LKIVTIVGARPQFIKAAMTSRVIKEHNARTGDEVLEEIFVHTGQHYDENMSRIFFDQMQISLPKYNLEVGSGTHGGTTGRMLVGIENILLDEKPDLVLVYGDTNSTLAGALAAAKVHIPVAHVEAGLRSFNKRMPEEINRILTDHVSQLLFCPTMVAVNNLRNEGITRGVNNVGDVMYDATLMFRELAEEKSCILFDLGVESGSYCLATVHRAENTESPERLKSIFSTFIELATVDCPIILPLHPRTAACIKRQELETLIYSNTALRVIEPVSFLDMVLLEKHSKIILTDSGGVQKEAYFHGVPCVTLRDETEWVETIEAGWNQLAGAIKDNIIKAVNAAAKGRSILDYGVGDAAAKIVSSILNSNDC